MNTKVNADAFNVLLRIVEQFPGLLDLEEPIDGADLINAMTYLIHKNEELRSELQ